MKNVPQNWEGEQNSAAKMAASATCIRDSVISVMMGGGRRRHGNDAIADDSCGSHVYSMLYGGNCDMIE
jgi:hypothetical protein